MSSATPKRTAVRYAPGDLPAVQTWAVDGFAWWCRGYLRKHFHAVRLSRRSPPPDLGDEGAVLYCNHPSWWDPLVGLIVARGVWGKRSHYAPFDAAALARYRFLERLGFFGVEPGTSRGAARFLRAGQAILGKPGGTLWVTAAGRFHDVRERPILLKPGLGGLSCRMASGVVAPMAIEYPFWDERLPEALVAFGPPIRPAEHPGLTSEEWTRLLESRLSETMDRLAEDAAARDPARFTTLLAGRTAIGGMYDFGRRWLAWFRGEKFTPEHSPSGSTIQEPPSAPPSSPPPPGDSP